MSDFRPLKTVGTALSKWARQDGACTTVNYSGRLRTAVDHAGMALSWMSRGYQFDNRTFLQRMKAGNWFWRAAARAIFA